MKKFSRIILGLLLTAWFLLPFHKHARHAGDLHHAHEACRVCAHASWIFQGVLPAAAVSLLPPLQSRAALPLAQQKRFSSVSISWHHSRAPPLS